MLYGIIINFQRTLLETVVQINQKSEEPIVFLRKRIETLDFKVYVVLLFKVDQTLKKAELIRYCRRKKDLYLFDAVQVTYVFFDDEAYADFPRKVAKELYSSWEEEIVAKHIKAIYTSNIVNGFSKLFYYQENFFCGEVEEAYYLDGFVKRKG